MTTYIGLLRAVNLAGHRMVSMAALREILTALGMQDARSLLQSGNLVFRTAERSAASLERTLESETERRLGLTTEFVVRTAEEWQAVIARNPFREEARNNPSRLVVFSLKGAAGRKEAADLAKAIAGPEVVRVTPRSVYIVYPEGIGRSRLTSALIERTLGSRGTGRNWNTVLKIAALAATS
jgi:uncharacterized protein (DUF1697 family)